MNKKFFIRLFGICIIVQNIFTILLITIVAAMGSLAAHLDEPIFNFTRAVRYLPNGSFFIVVLFIVGIIFVIAPKWLVSWLSE